MNIPVGKHHRFIRILATPILACNIAACSGGDETALSPDRQNALDAWEAEHGAIVQRDLDETSPWADELGEPGGEYAPMPKRAGQIMLQGWAVRGHAAELSDGLHHWVPDATTFGDSTFLEFNSHARGRCGRFDGILDGIIDEPSGVDIGTDLAFLPCILPHGRDSSTGKRAKKWKFDRSRCPSGDTATWQKQMVWAAAGTLFAENGPLKHTGWKFTENTGTADDNTWVIYCTNATESALMRAGEKVGVGYPAGPVTMSHFAGGSGLVDHVDICEAPGSTGARFNYMTDVISTTKRGRIGINWETWWNWAFGCSIDEPTLRVMITNLLAHELAHTLGFAHQTDTPHQVMHAEKTCAKMMAPFSGYRAFMENALFDYSLPVLARETLQLFDEDLACYSPGGPP